MRQQRWLLVGLCRPSGAHTCAQGRLWRTFVALHVLLAAAATRVLFIRLYLQVSSAETKLKALEDMGQVHDAHVQSAVCACLSAQLADSQSTAGEARKREELAHAAVSSAVACAAGHDERAARLRLTGESLAQGLRQMLDVRAARAAALEARQQVDALKTRNRLKRKEAKDLHRQVRGHLGYFPALH